MADIGDEAEAAPDRSDDRRRVEGNKFPRPTAGSALEMSMFAFGEDMELLSTGR